MDTGKLSSPLSPSLFYSPPLFASPTYFRISYCDSDDDLLTMTDDLRFQSKHKQNHDCMKHVINGGGGCG